MRYDTYRYLWPTRPDLAVAPTTIASYEAMGWLGQAKMNGTNCTLYVPPDRASFAMGRHGPDNRLRWQPGERWGAFQAQLPGEGWYVFQGELLHDKGVGVRDTIYLFDMLVEDGEYLIGVSLRDRLRRLGALCKRFPDKSFDVTHTVITPGVWLVTPHARAFSAWFASLDGTTIEGLVFKNPAAPLAPCGRASANASWQHKCRKPTGTVSF